MKWLILIIIMLLAIINPLPAQTTDELNATEKIFFNAKIFTADERMPYAEAVAVKGNKIVAVGNLYKVKGSVGANAVLIDLQGKCLLPGFVDSHNHAIEGGEGLMTPHVDDTILSSKELLSYANKIRSSEDGMMGRFLVINGINITTWSDISALSSAFNSGEYLKQAVMLFGSDGHTGWGNAVMMNEAGITKSFLKKLKPYERKYFGVAPDGTSNGFVADSGLDKIYDVIPEDTFNWKEGAIKAVEYNNHFGITSWLDPAAGDISDGLKNHILDAYAYLAEQHKLTAHIAAVVVANADGDPAPQISTLKAVQKKYNVIPNVNVIGFKIFADGVIEYPTQTAALSRPYINSGSYGALMFDPENFARFVTMADKEKLLVHVHAIGDRAVTESLNGFEAARKANGNTFIPHTITHLQIVQPSDFPRFKQLGVLASYQLLWALGDPTTIEIVKPYIAPELYQWQYPARSLLQAGATICGSSDWNVSTANPFEAMYEAETRKGDEGVLDSTQCMPRMSMLLAYTINSAKAMMEENNIGSITSGKFADFVLVDRDVLTVDPESFENTKVLWTMFEGKVVYERK